MSLLVGDRALVWVRVRTHTVTGELENLRVVQGMSLPREGLCLIKADLA
jgi:hypothetical protein